MRNIKLFMLMLLGIVMMASFACTSNPTSSEGPEGSGGEGNEGGGGEGGNESGTVWQVADTAVEIVNGVQLTLSYNAVTNSFDGELENVNTTTAVQVKVEIHINNTAGQSIEYGPTTPGNMLPGSKRSVTLPVPNSGTIVSFVMHPEVGGSGGGS